MRTAPGITADHTEREDEEQLSLLNMDEKMKLIADIGKKGYQTLKVLDQEDLRSELGPEDHQSNTEILSEINGKGQLEHTDEVMKIMAEIENRYEKLRALSQDKDVRSELDQEDHRSITELLSELDGEGQLKHVDEVTKRMEEIDKDKRHEKLEVLNQEKDVR